MAYVERTPRPKTKRYRAGYTNYQGRQVRFIGTTNRKETLARAQMLEEEHRQIRLGCREEPQPWDSARKQPIAEAAAEYLAWGNAQGGRGGRPWSPKHAEKRAYYLRFWLARLRLQTIGDLVGVLPSVESALRELQAHGRPETISPRAKSKARPLAGKSLQNYADGLTAFCEWLVDRRLLREDPLRGLAPFDTTPKTQRRAMTADEVQRFLNAIEESGTVWARRRRLGYELALASGLRKGELQALKVKDLDQERCGVRLHAEWTKNRKAGFQPLPAFLVAKLAEHAQGKDPEDALVFVARECSVSFRRDLKRAGIPVTAPGGKLDFHALRVAYTTFVLEAGADAKTAQTLARHSTPTLTMNTYARARMERLAEVAEKVGEVIPQPTTAAEIMQKTGTDDDPLTPPLRHQQESQSCKGSQELALATNNREFQIPPCPPLNYNVSL